MRGLLRRRPVAIPALLTLGVAMPLSPASAARLVDLPGLSVAHGEVHPSALASADFDGDGMPDLAVGYAGAAGGALAIHRGNVDALFPNAPQARQRRAEGQRVEDAFLPAPSTVHLPFAVDLLGAGDFDNDGRADLVAASSGGSSLHVLRGDGGGGVSSIVELELGGRLGTMVVGDVNRADGVPDLVVSALGPGGPSLAVFESPGGVLAARPETIPLPVAPFSILLARVGSDRLVSILAAAEEELLLVEGRDRRLLVAAPGEGEATPAGLRRLSLPAPIESAAWGDFLAEPDRREELAVVTHAGHLLVLDLRHDAGAAVLRPVAWGGLHAPVSTVVPARISGRAQQDLLLLDASGGPVRVSSGLRRGESPAHGEDLLPAETASLGTWSYPEVAGRIRAVLPLRLNADARPDFVILQEGSAGPTLAPSAPQAVITVNSNLDVTVSGDGRCTLREAINNANANDQTTAGDCVAGAGLDTIAFAIRGGGNVESIAVLAPALPAVSDGVVIDGTTQGCPAPPCIELTGLGAGAGVTGLRLTGAGGSTVRGLVVNRFSGHGIYGTTSGNVIEGNRIGTDTTGMVAQANGAAGIRFQGTAATSNTIGGTAAAARNLVSGNAGSGIVLLDGATGNAVLGNHVGFDAAGTGALPNSVGVYLSGVGTASNTIGGTVPGAGNVTSGNSYRGIQLYADSGGHTVQGNLVGVDPSGSFALGNGASGIWAYDSDVNLIGGTAAGARNVVSGNATVGIALEGSSGNTVSGNYVGTAAGGTTAIGNLRSGIYLYGASSNVVGGTTSGARNVVSGNVEDGILVANLSDDNDVLGNHVGVDAAGTTAVPNGLAGIELDHSSLCTIGGATPGARNVASGNTYGILLDVDSDGNEVAGNWVGINAAGTAAVPNLQVGIWLVGAGGNTIGPGNVASGNETIGNPDTGFGILLGTGADGNTIVGNYAGTDPTGAFAIGNARAGIRLQGASGNVVGGSTPQARNISAGNGRNGVSVVSSANNNQVLGNYLGVDATGTLAIPNGGDGAEIEAATGNTIGPGNVISGNAEVGVFLESNAVANTVRGNYVGTDATGTTAIGNGRNGIQVGCTPFPGSCGEGAATSNVIGGTTPEARNVVAGSGGDGVFLMNASSDTVVQGNSIGTDATGALVLGNSGHGVRVLDSARVRIGGDSAGQGNLILNNGAAGVVVHGTSTDSPILGNVIAGNALLGIDLGASDGVTPNDPADPDTGPNGLQNFPLLSSVQSSPSEVVSVEGVLDSIPASSFRIEFFASGSCDASGHGEGRRYLGFTDVVTDGSGTGSFSASLTAPVQAGEMVTATATSPTNCTSEFSACTAASCSSLAVFPHTVLASDRDHLTWGSPADVRWVKGDLSEVDSYSSIADGELLAASGLDTAADQPPPQSGLYYLVRPLICGSWQSSPGSEPGRDSGLP